MRWDPTDVESFFDRKLASDPSEKTPSMWWIDYEGQALRYAFAIDDYGEVGQISAAGELVGHDQRPFGPDSLFEIYVPCTDIEVCSDPYREGTGLRFFFGDPNVRGTLMLTVLKRQDGDLKVWATVAAEAFRDPRPSAPHPLAEVGSRNR